MLIVDDNASARAALRETLASLGMRAFLAEDGPAALELLGRTATAGEPAPLMLLDAGMPGMDGLEVARRIHETPALSGAVVVLLTDAGRRLPDERTQHDLGVRGRLTKPIKNSELLKILLDVVGAAPAAVEHRARGAARRGRALRVLLAEDNAVNQKLAMRLLEKEGHAVTLAANGRSALDALAAADFDVVLMDVQMPEMDGFEATAAIRRREAGTGRRIPIVAMTAHAMKGDRERCLEAGMDGYVAKPIRADELRLAIDEVLPLPGGAALSREGVVALFGGDESLFREIAQLFLEDGPGDLRELRKALERGDAGSGARRPTVSRERSATSARRPRRRRPSESNS